MNVSIEYDKAIADMGRTDIPLDPELQECVQHLKHFPVLRHPLVYAVPYMSGTASLMNFQLRLKKDSVQYALRVRDWEQYVFLHERPHRVDAFVSVEHRLSDRRFWKLLRDVWIDTENAWQNKELWEDLFTRERRNPYDVMNAAERKALAKLPPTVKVYRGCCDLNKNGISWTLDREVAQRFAKRQHRRSRILERTIKRESVRALFLDRGEDEVIVL